MHAHHASCIMHHAIIMHGRFLTKTKDKAPYFKEERGLKKKEERRKGKGRKKGGVELFLQAPSRPAPPGAGRWARQGVGGGWWWWTPGLAPGPRPPRPRPHLRKKKVGSEALRSSFVKPKPLTYGAVGHGPLSQCCLWGLRSAPNNLLQPAEGSRLRAGTNHGSPGNQSKKQATS